MPRIQVNARQQELAQCGLSAQRRWGEELKRAFRKCAGLRQAPFLVEHQGLVQIDGRSQGLVLLAGEQVPSLAEQVQRKLGIAVMAGSDRQIGHGLGGFVAHPELLEGVESPPRQVRAFLAQVQLEVHFRLVQVAQPLVIGVPQRVAVLARGAIELDGAGVLASQVIQIGDVVIGMGHQQRHVVALRVGPHFVIRLQRLVELVQADLAGGHVLQRDGHVLGLVADAGKRRVGALVPFQGLFKAVLTVENVAHVGVQPRQPEVVAVFEKNVSGSLRAGERFVIPAQVNQGLERTADGAAHVEFHAQALVDGQSRLVVLARRFVLAFEVEDVSHGPAGWSPGSLRRRSARKSRPPPEPAAPPAGDPRAPAAPPRRRAVPLSRVSTTRFRPEEAGGAGASRAGAPTAPPGSRGSPGFRTGRTSEPFRFQNLLQPIETPPSNEPDGSRGQVEPLRHVGIRQRRAFEKEEFDHLPAPRR